MIFAFVTYTLVDIHIWQRIFETHEMWHFDYQYHFGWYIMFYGFLIFGILLLIPDLRAMICYGVTFWMISFNGTEDLFYYWLDGRKLPEYYHWLEHSSILLFHPVTRENLILNCIVYLVGLVFFWFFVYRFKFLGR